MSNVGYATLTIIPSAKGFLPALTKGIGPDAAKAGTAGGQAMGGGVMGAFKSLVGPAIAAFGVTAMTGFVKGAVGAAADLEQSIGAIDSVFKGSAGQMHAWSKSAAVDVGLTRNEFNELGTLIGSQLKNAGTSMEELGPKTNELIGLGADLSSMFGGTTADAVSALSSALKGERDPIERYGVSLTQAAIDAKAAEMGFEKVGGALSREANAAATVALIMDQTADAHGNFARESDTLAHKQQVLNAMWEDGKARLGEVFLPAVSAAAGGLIGLMGPAIDGTVAGVTWLMQAFGGLSDLLLKGDFTTAFRQAFNVAEDDPIVDFLLSMRESVAGVFDSIVAAVGPYLPQLMSAFGELGSTILGLLPMVSPLGLVFQALAPVLPQIASMLAQLAGVLAGALGQAVTLVAPLIGQMVSALSGAFVAILPTVVSLVGALAGVWQALIPAFLAIQGALFPVVTTLVEALAPILVQLVNAILPPVISIIQALVPAIEPVVGVIMGALIPIIEALMPVVVTVFGVIADVIGAAMGIIQGIISAVSALIRGDWDAFWAAIGQILSGVWDLIVSVVQGAINIVSSVIGAAMGLIGDLWRNGWNAVGDWLGNVWDGIVSTITGWIDGLVGMGQDIMQGLIDGIVSMAGAIGDAIMGPITGAIDGVKDFLGIHSPSRLMRGIGVNTGEGYALGLEDTEGRIADASSVLAPTVPSQSVAAPSVEEGGVMGALATASAYRGGDVNLYAVPTDDELRKIKRALVQGRRR